MKDINLQTILKNKIELKRYEFEAVYFLIHNNEMVYVGQTRNLKKRIQEHISDKKMRFDSWYYIKCECPKSIEKYFIKKFNPKYNFQGCENYYNERKFLYSRFRRTRKSLEDFSKETGLSVTKINSVFNLNKRLNKSNLSIIRKALYPNGYSKRILKNIEEYKQKYNIKDKIL